jgi:hypothetical protein
MVRRMYGPGAQNGKKNETLRYAIGTARMLASMYIQAIAGAEE